MSLYSPDLNGAIGNGGDVVEVRTGSDSDFPKIQSVLDSLQADNIPYILRILSAHRTPEQMMEAAQTFPEIILPQALRGLVDMSNIRTKFCIAAAGGSAHIAGMTASETQTPVIALPVASSSSGLIDASFSMINMPPGIPNGFVPNNNMGAIMSNKLFNLQLDSTFNKVSMGIPTHRISDEDKKLLDELGIEIDENRQSPVSISPTGNGFNNDHFQILSICSGNGTDIDPMNALQLVQNDFKHNGVEGVYMGLHADTVKLKNHILFAAQILAIFNPNIKAKLDNYRKRFADEVRKKDLIGTAKQIGMSPLKIKLLDSGLWPEDKKMTLEKGEPELEELGYELFYKGKNADLYLVPDSDPIQVLMVRSDRTSVFDIKLDLEIEGKGEIQTQISKLGAKFAEDRGVETCFTELPNNIPEALQGRSQTMELCKPLTMEIDGEEKGLELIFRNYNAGSLYNKFYKKNIENPYGVELPEGMNEWDKFPEPIFTPTTKDKQDTPVNSDMVRGKFPELIAKLEKLFEEFTQFMYERGYIVVDTKVEVFLNAQGEPVLGDEIFTPESSRFIRVEDFEAGKFISADKQIIRKLGEEFGWEARLQEILDKNPNADRYLKVSNEVTPDKRKELLDGYTDIQNAMSA